MKFCKALQKVAEASDPSFLPYWPHYKKLKKLIKAITACDDDGVDMEEMDDGKLPPGYEARNFFEHSFSDANSLRECLKRHEHAVKNHHHSIPDHHKQDFKETKTQLEQNPQEVAFFQLLYSELGKATDFFGKTQRQFMLREEIVRVGMEVLKRPPSAVIKDRWTVLSRAVFVLYKDLLLLETFAIMTYFAFSKILKKHDKVTGHDTRGAFMVNVVNKANFTNYPKILEMIERCQMLYNDASQRLLQGMYEDERLFLFMVQHMGQHEEQPYVRGGSPGHRYSRSDEGGESRENNEGGGVRGENVFRARSPGNERGPFAGMQEQLRRSFAERMQEQLQRQSSGSVQEDGTARRPLKKRRVPPSRPEDDR